MADCKEDSDFIDSDHNFESEQDDVLSCRHRQAHIPRGMPHIHNKLRIADFGDFVL